MSAKRSNLHTLVARLVKELSVRVRIKSVDFLESSNWAAWYIEPTEGYVELEKAGPVRQSEIEWIELDPIEMKHQGRLLPEKRVDHSGRIVESLSEEGHVFEVRPDGHIRIQAS